MTKILITLRRSWIYILGIASVAWFIIRVIPKPDRAAYPCQRAAFPIASAFMIWLTSTLFTFRFFRVARTLFRNNRAMAATGLVIAGAGLLILSNLLFPARELVAGGKASGALAPEMILSYNRAAEQFIDPRATVSIVHSEREDVLSIDKEEVELMVREAVALAGGLENIVSDGQTVVLKPNIVVYDFLGSAIPTEANGMVTDWRVVAAVAKMVRELNPSGEILVIEGSAGVSTMDGYEVLNYTRQYIPEVDEFLAMEEISGEWHDYESADLRSVLLSAERVLYPDFKLPDGSAPYYYSKRYYEADVIISLPVLKNHESAGVTGAIKNMGIGGTPTNIYGNSQNQNGRWEVINHAATRLHQFIHDYYYGCPAQFAVMDGIQGYSNGPNFNYGPRNLEGHQEHMGLILASGDPVAMDAIASLVMFDDPGRVPHLVHLNNSAIGCADPMAIRVAGTLVSDIKKPFEHESHATDCDYSDDNPPVTSIDRLTIEDQTLQLSLAGTEDLSRVDIRVDGKDHPQFIIGDFGDIEIDLESFELTDTLITLFAHDRYLNTSLLTAKGTRIGATGREYQDPFMGLSLYPNPVLAELRIRMVCEEGGEVAVSIYNLTGQAVKERMYVESAGQIELGMDVSDMEPGHYILAVSVSGARKSVPFIKY